MKIFYRILKIIAIIIVVLVTTLFIASFVMQDTVAGIILRSLNKNLSTKYEFASVKLSFLKKFPNASVELRNVLVHPSNRFDRNCFKDINTDTLLFARQVSVEFSIADVARGIYDIDRIGIKDGRLNLLTDTAGKINYEIYVESTAGGQGGNFLLNLDRINLSGMSAVYDDRYIDLLLRGYVENGRMRSRITSDKIDFKADGGLRIDYFRLMNYTISRSIPSEVDLDLVRDSGGFLFNESTLRLDKYLISMRGSISKENVMDLALAAKGIDLSYIRSFLPDSLRAKVEDYDPSGILNAGGTIKGLSSSSSDPAVRIDFDLGKGNVVYRKSPVRIRDLSVKGSFSSGSRKNSSEGILEIDDFSGTLGSSQYKGYVRLSGFDPLLSKVRIKGTVRPDEISEFFGISTVSSASGSIDMDLHLEGIMPDREKYSFADFLSLNPVADLQFNAFSIGLNNDRTRFEDVTGNIRMSDTLIAEDLDFRIRDNKINVDGSFMNFHGWISGRPVILKGQADLTCGKLEPEKLFAPEDQPSDGPAGKQALRFPADISVGMNLKIDHFIYKTFEARNISGNLTYNPGVLNFNTLNLTALDGAVSGNGLLAQNRDKSFVARGSFGLEDINIRKAFESFRNFGQDFIRAENLAGKLSGSVSVLIPADSLFKPDVKSVTAEGKFVIANGSLIDFGPVKELSSFISLSELENIKFEKLENDFFIRTNYFYLPQMDVRSSAADLAINGKHSFENEYEYHVRIRLSEALSKKIRKPKPNTTEFGAVEDDGLGRTSLLLKIESRGNDTKVSYDVKAAGTKVREEIRSERQNLKSILNQEFGWYRNDTTVAKPAETKPKRFRIIWEETDTVKIDQIPQ
jgi:hypothetical protein